MTEIERKRMGSYKIWRLLTGSSKGIVCVSGLIFDIDNTLYHHPEYHAAGTRGEISQIASILGHSYDDMESVIAMRKQDIALRLDRPATMTETVLSLGITREEWNQLRCLAWQPEDWLTSDQQICELMIRLNTSYKIAFATNSPIAIGRRVLQSIGIMGVMPEALVFGPESFGVSKPNPSFFSLIAQELGLRARKCVSIGDREEADGTPAIAADYAYALIVPGNPHALVKAVLKLLDQTRMEVVHG